MKDYFPLSEGLCLEYRTQSSAQSGGWRFEVVSSVTQGVVTRAHCRRTPLGAGAAVDLTVTKDDRGVFMGRALEFPLPAEPGRRWTRAPNAYRIADLDAVKTVPAGTFRDCLRVVYLIAGGDAGCGERLYAPGVGLIYDMCADESDPCELALARMSVPDDRV